jgi:hypothetical protein
MFPWVKQLVCTADRLPPCSALVKNDGAIFTPPYMFMALIKQITFMVYFILFFCFYLEYLNGEVGLMRGWFRKMHLSKHKMKDNVTIVILVDLSSDI